LAAVAALAVSGAVLVVSGCGGGSSSSSTTSATVTWADGVCSAIVSYKTSVTDTGQTLKANPSKAGLSDAAQSLQGATDDLVTTLKGLDEPGTDAGATAKQTLDVLSTQLQAGAQAIKEAAAGASLVSAAAVVSTTLLSLQTDIKSAVDQFGNADAKGELQDAFSQASSCADLPGL
jgi:hypothetical protein